MKVNFRKYQGVGNDFILIDNRELSLSRNDPNRIQKWCDRRFGIGADGVMFLERHDRYDFEMVYFNADGKQGSMCGNGGRCIVAFAHYLGLIDKETHFLAADGPHYAKIADDQRSIRLQMIDVETITKKNDAFILNTGSPHYISFTQHLEKLDVFAKGRAIRYSSEYKEQGINVNFIEDKGDYLFVRTYERGVEDETLACGTGVTAAAIVATYTKKRKGNITTVVKVPGGDLKIYFETDGLKYRSVFLEGPAEFVYEGIIYI